MFTKVMLVLLRIAVPILLMPLKMYRNDVDDIAGKQEQIALKNNYCKVIYV